ncbi:aspartyl-phosphate phosphatase Spo0E family protein [Clostridium sp. MB40-C1]|uniref:aspartyl-phosphate phosphatase Spo0E family protein n=1 Tax=Clostridium sp. MB40-C1 TaxID=3070996 RepID=UPI0027E05505|nr:aspartyl-phosphate phosphatase Spo0E family protein [Clostridium sp. MB40-C1]WMJ79086.1 aspartyl-phosphate phosphatase Spo0E family protein [Clostridium sp. MB40-C1]
MKLYKYIGGKTENIVEREIKNLKHKFNNLIVDKNLMDCEVVELSKNIDELLIHYIKFNVKI